VNETLLDPESTGRKRMRDLGDLSGRRLFEDAEDSDGQQTNQSGPSVDDRLDVISKRRCNDDISERSTPQKRSSLFKLMPTGIVTDESKILDDAVGQLTKQNSLYIDQLSVHSEGNAPPMRTQPNPNAKGREVDGAGDASTRFRP